MFLMVTATPAIFFTNQIIAGPIAIHIVPQAGDGDDRFFTGNHPLSIQIGPNIGADHARL